MSDQTTATTAKPQLTSLLNEYSRAGFSTAWVSYSDQAQEGEVYVSRETDDGTYHLYVNQQTGEVSYATFDYETHQFVREKVDPVSFNLEQEKGGAIPLSIPAIAEIDGDEVPIFNKVMMLDGQTYVSLNGDPGDVSEAGGWKLFNTGQNPKNNAVLLEGVMIDIRGDRSLGLNFSYSTNNEDLIPDDLQYQGQGVEAANTGMIWDGKSHTTFKLANQTGKKTHLFVPQVMTPAVGEKPADLIRFDEVEVIAGDDGQMRMYGKVAGQNGEAHQAYFLGIVPAERSAQPGVYVQASDKDLRDYSGTFLTGDSNGKSGFRDRKETRIVGQHDTGTADSYHDLGRGNDTVVVTNLVDEQGGPLKYFIDGGGKNKDTLKLPGNEEDWSHGKTIVDGKRWEYYVHRDTGTYVHFTSFENKQFFGYGDNPSLSTREYEGRVDLGVSDNGLIKRRNFEMLHHDSLFANTGKGNDTVGITEVAPNVEGELPEYWVDGGEGGALDNDTLVLAGEMDDWLLTYDIVVSRGSEGEEYFGAPEEGSQIWNKAVFKPTGQVVYFRNFENIEGAWDSERKNEDSDEVTWTPYSA